MDSPATGLELLSDERFVWDHVWPLVRPAEAGSRPATFRLTPHRSREDGRAVAEITFEGSARVFAKLYPHAAEARAVFRIHDELRKHGFGPESAHRVPAPLGLLEDRRGLVLLEPASGRALTIADAQNPAAFEHGVRRAAAWLGVLHSAPVSAGPAESTAQAAYRLAGRAVKATALCPDLAAVFRQMLTELGRRHATTGEKRGDVQTHGRFHAGHVFLARDCVTGVDLDRAALTDPAKDVAEYLFGLRALAARRVLTDRAVDDLCDAFLDEYRGRTPGDLAGLTYHWSYVVAWALLGLAFKDRPGRRGWSDRVEFMRAEFDGAPGRVAAWLALA